METFKSLNFARQTVRMDSRSVWIYIQRIVTGLSAGLVFFLIQTHSSSGSAGLFFFYYFYPALIVLMSFSCISEFSGAIAEERGQGTLQILLLTGTNPFSLLAGRAAGKFFQIFFLYILLIPATVFTVTLGGISLEEIFSLFIVLFFWLLFVSSISLWASIFFSTKKEAMLISSVIVTLVLILTTFAGQSPFHKFDEIVSNSTVISWFVYDMFIYSVASFLFILYGVLNFKYTSVFPISFLENSEINLIKKNHLKNFAEILKKKGNSRVRFDKKFIREKDRYIYPKASLFPNLESGVTVFFVIVLFIITVPFSLFMLIFWWLFGSLLFTWKRVLDAFNREINDNTLSTLFLTPYTFEEIIDRKVKGCRAYETTLKVYYYIILIIGMVLVLSLYSMSRGTGVYHLLFGITCLPALYFTLIYSTVLACLKIRELTASTSFLINMFLIILYFSYPMVIAPLSIAAYMFLKNRCAKELEQMAEIS